MAQTSIQPIRHGWLSAIVLILGGLFTLWLQRYVQGGVFFSGDGGLKALLAQQFASGNLQIDLQLPAPDWAQVLWRQGLYPFAPPFAYTLGDRHFITFPFTFPAVTAPFYALMGYRGLYVVPLVALWLLWWRFYQVCRQLALPPSLTAASLATVVFASPLLPYGAMYWEHSLAVLLAFWGLSLLLFPKGPMVTLPMAWVAGSLTGLAVWFRPEFLCWVAALAVVAIASWQAPKLIGGFRLSATTALGFTAAMIGSVALFFALNFSIYGHPLGIHAIQIVEESSLSQQITQAWANYQQLLSALIGFFPMVLLVFLSPLVWLKFRDRHPAASTLILLILGILFALAVPLIIPPGAGGKQWGPRFYLILIPIAVLVIAQGLNQLPKGLGQRSGLALFALLFALGFHMNTLNGGLRSFNDAKTQSISLAKNYTPMAPAIRALAAHPSQWVAMSHQFVAQGLWAAVPDKTFFLVETPAALKQLGEALMQQGESSFLYLCQPSRDCPMPELPASDLQFKATGHTVQLRFESLGTFGKYPSYNVKIKINE